MFIASSKGGTCIKWVIDLSSVSEIIYDNKEKDRGEDMFGIRYKNQVRAILQNDDIEIRDTNLKRIQENPSIK